MQVDTTTSLELEDATLELEATELEEATLELDLTELEDATLELETTTPPQDVSTHHQVWLASSLIHCGTPSLTRAGFMV